MNVSPLSLCTIVPCIPSVTMVKDMSPAISVVWLASFGNRNVPMYSRSILLVVQATLPPVSIMGKGLDSFINLGDLQRELNSQGVQFQNEADEKLILGKLLDDLL